MIDDYLIEVPRFEPLARFHRGGAARVFYKGSSKQKPTAEEYALAEVANKRWADYKQNTVPAQDKYMKTVDNMGTEEANQAARGIAGSAVSAKYSEAEKPTLGLVGRRGLNVNSGAAKASLAKLTTDQGTAAAEAIDGASLSQEDQHIGGLQSVTAMGRGQASGAQSGLTNLAQSAAAAASNKAVSDFNSNAATLEAAGTLAGAYGKYKYPKGFAKPSAAGMTDAGSAETYKGMS